MPGPRPPVQPRSVADEATFRAVDEFTFEVALLFFRMRATATGYLGQGRHSTGRRSLLKSLAAGPQTVPAMARRRAVSRQHIQKLVDGLYADGLVRTEPNPHDRRSLLVNLTARGAALLAEIKRREVDLFGRLVAGVSTEHLTRATETVRELRTRLEAEPWASLAAQGGRGAGRRAGTPRRRRRREG